MPFTSFGFPSALLKALADENYATPTPIQQAAIPAVLNKKDVLGIAKTGSGKTAGYVLPVLMNLQHSAATKNRHISALVMVPTRELAVQVNEVFGRFIHALPQTLKVLAVYGGVAVNPQMKALMGVNILIATPGRLLELLDSNSVNLSDVQILVLDEADKMLNLGFKEEMDRIIKLLPQKRQNLLFSATLSEEVSQINQILLHEPEIIKITSDADDLDLISQCAYLIPEEKKGPFLRQLIRHYDMKQVLVFASSVYQAEAIADKLRKNGIDAKAIHSKKSQGARTEALYNFKNARLRVLVATDLMSRGIDINVLPYVINYELPRSPKDYIHRIGRTGRAETKGEAISLISPKEEHHFGVIQKKVGKAINLLDSNNLI